MAVWKLFCLGRPILELDGKPVKLEMRKSLALLIYLRLSDHDFSRETLSTLFWPEYDQQHAQSNLRRILSSLNKSINEHFLESDRNKIGLVNRSKIWLDVDRFSQIVFSINAHSQNENQTSPDFLSQLEEAVRLYQGDFLDGFNLGDSPGFDEWQSLQRESLRQELSKVLETLTVGYSTRSEWEPAVTYARQWLALDRLNDSAQRMLIEIYTQSGQRNLAMRQYQEFLRLLKGDGDRSPDKETLAIIDQQKSRDSFPDGGSEIPISTPKQVVPILKTKLYIPLSHQAIVNRDRLISRLDQGVQRPLTLISSPVGSGKTTILVDWAKHSQMPIAWISLDNGDSDPTRFLTYLILAIDSLYDGVGGDCLAMLQTFQPLPWELTLTQFIIQLEAINEPFVLVLDDYQFIESQSIHELLTFLLDHLPPKLHIILSTRSEPPLPLSRLRARGQLYELRADDLRFLPEETDQLLNQIMRLNLNSEEISTLENRTEGWVVGLQMVGIALNSIEGSKTQFIQSFTGSHRYILDYLVEEVLNHLPDRVQNFLLQTSVLGRLSASLCDTVIGKFEEGLAIISQSQNSTKNHTNTPFTNSHQILEYLERANLFLIPLDGERYWFRYHHLFADLLRSRLRQSLPDKENILHDRAAKWYEQEGMIDEAVYHATSAKNIEHAVKMITQYALKMIANGEMQTVQKWLDILPEEEFLNRPWLDIYQAWVWLILGQVDGVPLALSHAEKNIHTEHPDTEDLQGNIALLRAEYTLLNGNQAQSIELLNDAQRLISKESVIPRMFLPLLFGDEYLFIGDMEKASHYLREASNLSRQFGNIYISLLSLGTLGYAYRFQGKLREAEQIFQEAIRLGTDKCGQHSILLSSPLIGYSDVLYEWNKLEMALKLAEEGIRSAERVGRANLIVHGYIALGQALQAQGDFESVGEAIQKAEQWILSHKVNSLTSSRLINLKFKYWLATNKPEEINRWESDYVVKIDDNLIHPAILELVAQARKFIFQREEQRALNLLLNLDRIVAVKGLTSTLIQIRLLLSLVLLGRGDIHKSANYFEMCITLAEPGGFLRIFMDEGPQVIQLINEYQKQVKDGRLELNQALQMYTDTIRNLM